MPLEIKTISLSLYIGLGSVNCYLIKSGSDCFLIDTGWSNRRHMLDKKLQNAGCHTGNLKLIVLTYGDFDHAGNAAYLSSKFGVKVAMHHNDLGMVEQGNIFWNRKKRSDFAVKVTAALFRFGKSDRFQPDVFLKDGDSLSGYGLDAEVLHLPGHSAGSIAILTTGGDLFCGYFLINEVRPKVNSIIDDVTAARVSLDKLEQCNIRVFYPGHGRPFSMDSLMKSQGNFTI